MDFNMYYYRDNNQNEIDFIILKDGNLLLIEAKAGKKLCNNHKLQQSNLQETPKND